MLPPSATVGAIARKLAKPLVLASAIAPLAIGLGERAAIALPVDPTAIAVDPVASLPVRPALSGNLLETINRWSCGSGSPAATEADIRQTGLTPPSLWLEQDLFGRKVLSGWRVYLSERRDRPWVDLVLNVQPWGNLTYLERYDFLQAFGQTAAAYGYDLRLCTTQTGRSAALGLYSCQGDPNPDGPPCTAILPGALSAASESPLF